MGKWQEQESEARLGTVFLRLQSTEKRILKWSTAAVQEDATRLHAVGVVQRAAWLQIGSASKHASTVTSDVHPDSTNCKNTRH